MPATVCASGRICACKSAAANLRQSEVRECACWTGSARDCVRLCATEALKSVVCARIQPKESHTIAPCHIFHFPSRFLPASQPTFQPADCSSLAHFASCRNNNPYLLSVSVALSCGRPLLVRGHAALSQLAQLDHCFARKEPQTAGILHKSFLLFPLLRGPFCAPRLQISRSTFAASLPLLGPTGSPLAARRSLLAARPQSLACSLQSLASV